MVTLSKIYTRGGDKGETSLGGGKRVAKHSLRVAAYGTSDEANAIIGIARLHTEGEADAMLARIQNDLFDVGADLCTPPDAERKDGAPHLAQGCHRAGQRVLDHLEHHLLARQVHRPERRALGLLLRRHRPTSSPPSPPPYFRCACELGGRLLQYKGQSSRAQVKDQSS